VALELDELDAIVKFVENGLGVSLIPQAGLWLERDVNLRVIPLGSLTFHREVVLLMRRSQRDLPLHRLFARCLSKADPADEILCLSRS
jgi:DNA-binding transcriptional LysR family regulator